MLAISRLLRVLNRTASEDSTQLVLDLDDFSNSTGVAIAFLGGLSTIAADLLLVRPLIGTSLCGHAEGYR
jgi:hypothetical protein